MTGILEPLKTSLEDHPRSLSQSLLIVQNAVANFLDAEECVKLIMRQETCDPAMEVLLDSALTSFFGSREHQYGKHGDWVHSLSHFTNVLWKRRMTEWIKLFNLAAFTGANELMDANCCERLIDDFRAYAKWEDDPKDFNLGPEYIGYAVFERNVNPDELVRLIMAPFQSEKDFLDWKVNPTVDEVRKNDWIVKQTLTICKCLARAEADIIQKEMRKNEDSIRG